jgi:hypothetical protein
MAVEIFLDISEYTTVYADKFAQAINADVKNFARAKVAVKTSRLRNSIRIDKLGPASYQTVAQTPYAAAQEYGRPDLATYTFTPYMRPAAIKAGAKSNLDKRAIQASDAAERIAKK